MIFKRRKQLEAQLSKLEAQLSELGDRLDYHLRRITAELESEPCDDE